ncbi:RNA polymerase sigma factor region1.1 domain-containing protein [Methylobacterium sp. E-046]|uniref:RNA polymerase sigma factor region1.1 domain-containing protein n=1 Tax=Methylobacterium sp. E-046 TaxID=2836576 RepID=UPI001FBAC390|nr:RNA polymerase sigma factor region1.1 domain-containing protein [Methylobacterium sp. E-046]MCJ2101284.1 RNA polymerase sigma factor region1.1 domain-containing protein [Methylobacterium sp. E-046]
MSQTIDRGTLDRLIALGRARGGLSADDLRAALPVEQMDVDALVLVMLELETAGVSVEPDAFGPPVERPVAPSLVLPAPESEPAPPVRPADGGGAVTAPAAKRPAAPMVPPLAGPDDRAGVNRAVMLAAAATLLLLGAVLLWL